MLIYLGHMQTFLCDSRISLSKEEGCTFNSLTLQFL